MKFSCPSESIIDIVSSRRPECKWFQKESVGKGAQGEVFKVCCQENTDCDYVVKYYTPDQTTENLFLKEVNAHTEFEELGIAVPIIEAFYCPSHGSYIIMERRQMTIKQFICNLYKKGVPQRIIIDVIDKLNNELLPMLQLAYDNNLLHNDPHLENFMLDPVDEYDYANLTIIDFGKSGIMPHDDNTFDERYEKYNIFESEGRFKSDSINILQRKRNQDLISDLRMSFDLLKTKVLDKSICDDNPLLRAPQKNKARPLLNRQTEITQPTRSLFSANESPKPTRSLFSANESPQPTRSLFSSIESPQPTRSLFSSTESSQPTRNLFSSTESPILKAPTDLNRFRSLTPLNRGLFNSTESPEPKTNIPKYDDFKQL
jgi:hypothetical protein